MSRASGIPHGQLVRVHDWCFRDETLHQAITTLLRYHQALPLTASFGPGTTSSSDGTRYGVSASVLGARHLPRYFGAGRGLSVYSHVSDEGPRFALAVINCQPGGDLGPRRGGTPRPLQHRRALHRHPGLHLT